MCASRDGFDIQFLVVSLRIGRSTLAGHPGVTTNRSTVRLRPDLVLVPVSSHLSQWWVVKDPVALQYHQVLPVEYELLRLLDGTRSLDEVRMEFDRRCAPQRLTKPKLHQFLNSLYHQGLLLIDGADQGAHLLTRLHKARRDDVWRTLSSPLAIRFRGVDPQWLLDSLVPWLGWLFAPAGAMLGSVVILSALAFVFSRLDQFLGALPSMSVLLSPANLVWTGAAIALVKVLHELGHGVSCRKFGAECHELGVMLLVGVPCLYVNVSDAWTLSRRWQRAIVSLAGIWVELLLASVAAVVWATTFPGYVHTLSLNVMVVCTVSTLFFNGNPLLRYDGYYALSDMLGVPNLAPRSSQLAVDTLMHLWWDLPADSEPNLSPASRWMMIAFGVASTVYRLFVTVLVLWTLRTTLKAWNLENLVWGVIAVVAATMVIQQGKKIAWAVRETSAGNGSMVRGLVGAGLFVGAVTLVLMLPWPHAVRGPAIIEATNVGSVYSVVEGRLETALAAGTPVKSGEVVAQLSNDEMLRKLAETEGKRDRQKTWVHTLQSRRTDDPVAAAQLPAAISTLDDLENQLVPLRQDIARLTLRAPREGFVLPPPDTPRPPTSALSELHSWVGNPLLPENQQTWLETGTLVCQIGEPDQLDAVVYVSQSDVEFLSLGQQTEVLMSSGDTPLKGEIAAIAPLDVDELTPDQVLPESLSVVTSPDGVRRLSQAGYQVRIRLAAAPHVLLRSGGQARIQVGRWSLAQAAWRELLRTFRFEW